MKTPPAELLARLLTAFRAEAEEHAQVLADSLVDLENAPPDTRARLVERMFRSAHSLKGAARTVNLGQVEALCQRMEGVFVLWKHQPPPPDATQLDLLHQAVSTIATLARGSGDAPAPDEVNALIDRLGQLDRTSSVAASVAAPHDTGIPRRLAPTAGEAPHPPAAEPPATDAPSTGNIRVEADRIERVLYGVEEMLHLKRSLAQRLTELRTLISHSHTTRATSPIADPENAGDTVAARSTNPALRLGALYRDLERDRWRFVKLADQLRDDARTLLLLPFGTHASFFAKLVRDLGRDQGRPLEFVVTGREVEIDKRILDEIKDPLVHLLRNCVAHGLERPEVRRARNKPERGSVSLSVVPLDAQKIEISVADDGAGIDLDNIRRSAIQRGLLDAAAAERATQSELLALLFRSEFTTTQDVTEISGRGVGLAVVQERVDRLGGQIHIDTTPGRGTRFRLTLPVAQSTVHGLPIGIGSQEFVLPVNQVDAVVRVPASEIKTVQNRDTLLVEERTLRLVWLGTVLGVPHRPLSEGADARINAVIVRSGEHRVALAVDDVRQQEEMLVKPFRPPLRRVRNFMGATLDGADRILPILRVADVLHSAASATPGRPPRAAAPAEESRRRRVLLAEDSVTSRILLEDILESAGYDVATAVDGLDALTSLRAEHFDLLVSDVEMPRLDGIGLTTAVRADERLRDLPVILVTALASREARERGFDAGANAYIVKSRFDQSDLLETVRRFV